jgi:hypothetical protein
VGWGIKTDNTPLGRMKAMPGYDIWRVHGFILAGGVANGGRTPGHAGLLIAGGSLYKCLKE